MPALHSFLSQARSPSTWPLDFTLTFSRALFLEITLLSKLHPSLFVTSFHQQICSSISHLTNTLPLTPSPSSSDSTLLLLSIGKLLAHSGSTVLISRSFFNPPQLAAVSPVHLSQKTQWLPGVKSNGNTSVLSLLYICQHLALFDHTGLLKTHSFFQILWQISLVSPPSFFSISFVRF